MSSIWSSIKKYAGEAYDEAKGVVTTGSFFPDNPKRKSRAQQLSRDCKGISASMKDQMSDIQDALKTMNNGLLIFNGAPPTPPTDTYDYSDSQFQLEVGNFMKKVFDEPQVSGPLDIAASAYLLATGQIGGAEAAGVFQMAGWLLGLSVTNPAGVIIGVIGDKAEADSLRKAIHEGIEARLKFKKSYLANEDLITSLHAINDSLTNLHNLGYTYVQLQPKLQAMADTAASQLAKDYTSAAQTALAALDTSRDSWTNEDNMGG